MLKKTRHTKKPRDAKHPNVASFDAEQQLGELTLKGIAQPVKAFNVTGF